MEADTIKENQIKILNNLKETEMDINIVLLTREFSVGELASASPGTVFMFDTPISEPACLRVDGKDVAKGEVVQVGDSYGFRLKELIP